MTRRFHLGLRFNHHMVSLLKVPGESREVLGVAYPQEFDRRAQILHYWAIDAQSPRVGELNTVNLPLETRAQTALYYQVNEATRAQLDHRTTPLTQSRRDEAPGVKDRVHLGVNHASLPVESRPGRTFHEPNHGLSATPSARGRLGGRGPRG